MMKYVFIALFALLFASPASALVRDCNAGHSMGWGCSGDGESVAPKFDREGNPKAGDPAPGDDMPGDDMPGDEGDDEGEVDDEAPTKGNHGGHKGFK